MPHDFLEEVTESDNSIYVRSYNQRFIEVNEIVKLALVEELRPEMAVDNHLWNAGSCALCRCCSYSTNVFRF